MIKHTEYLRMHFLKRPLNYLEHHAIIVKFNRYFNLISHECLLTVFNKTTRYCLQDCNNKIKSSENDNTTAIFAVETIHTCQRHRKSGIKLPFVNMRPFLSRYRLMPLLIA